MTGLAELAPGLFERVYPVFGTNKVFREVADAREKEQGEKSKYSG